MAKEHRRSDRNGLNTADDRQISKKRVTLFSRLFHVCLSCHQKTYVLKSFGVVYVCNVVLIFLSPIGNFNGDKKIIENILTFPLLNKVLMCLTRIHGRKDQEIP